MISSRFRALTAARGPLWTFWLPGGLMLLQGMLIVGGMWWLISHAKDTTSRRALRVPFAVAAFDLAQPISAAEFAAYRARVEGTAAVAAPVPDTFSDVRFDSPPTPRPRPQDDLRPPPVDAALIEVSPFGPLPVVAPDGRTAWQGYSQPVDTKKIAAAKGVIAVIVENAGLSEPALAAFLAALPPAVTFAFNPYAPELDYWIGRTRALGHEALMGLPMEPKNFPAADPGPRALMKSYSDTRNIEAMKWTLGRGAGYVGVLTIMGDSFTETAWRIDPVLREIQKRGLMFVDASTRTGQTVTATRANALALPHAATGFRIGDDIAQDTIQDVLRATEKAALKQGQAVLVVPPYPVVLALMQQWLPMVAAAQIELVPVSHLAAKTLEK